MGNKQSECWPEKLTHNPFREPISWSGSATATASTKEQMTTKLIWENTQKRAWNRGDVSVDVSFSPTSISLVARHLSVNSFCCQSYSAIPNTKSIWQSGAEGDSMHTMCVAFFVDQHMSRKEKDTGPPIPAKWLHVTSRDFTWLNVTFCFLFDRQTISQIYAWKYNVEKLCVQLSSLRPLLQSLWLLRVEESGPFVRLEPGQKLGPCVWGTRFMATRFVH